MTAVDTLLVRYNFTTHCKRFVWSQPWGVITPLVFPLSHPFPNAGLNQQNYWNLAVWNRSLSPHDNIIMDTKSGMKDGMGWCCALLGYHPKVISRSLQGQTEKNHDCLLFHLFQLTHLGWRRVGPNVLQMTDDLTHYWSGTISPRIARGLYTCHFSLRGDYPLGIPLITPLSQRCSESTKLPKFCSVEHQLQPPLQHNYNGYQGQ